MEWVETTGRTIEEARELALDQLGVDSSEAEFETLEEPKSGLFGRTRGSARVRARIAPRAPRPKTERKRRTKKSSSNGNGNGKSTATADSDGAAVGVPDVATPKERSTDGGRDGSRSKSQRREPAGQTEKREAMDTAEQIDVLEAFLQELAASFGLEVSTTSRMEENQLTVDVSGEDLGFLVGPRLATLDAIQEVARHALQRQAAGREYAKVVVDVAGIRTRRQTALTEFVTTAAEQVRSDGTEVVFEVMSSLDRKHVHDLVADLDGVVSASEGEDPRRRVVLRQG